MIDWAQILYSFFGSLGFAGVFHLRGSKLWWSSLGGALVWLVYLVAGLFFKSFLVKFAFAGFALGMYAEFMAIYTHIPRTVYIAVGLIPLIPGAGLYYTVYNLYNHNLAKSLHYAKFSVGCSFSIIIGLLIAMAIWKVYRDIHNGDIVLGKRIGR